MSDFIVYTNRDNEYYFVIKENGTTTPLALTGADTFTAKLIKLSDRSLVASIDATLEDQPNGKIKLIIDSNTSATLKSERRGSADKYELKAAYALHIYGDTANAGKINLVVSEVFVDIGYA